jgi:hypothetical protein
VTGAVQNIWPGCVVVVPVAQSVHELAPICDKYLPVSHATHDDDADAPDAPFVLPGRQLKHVEPAV